MSVSKTVKDDPMAYANRVADMVMPDVLTYQPGTPAHYGVEALNDRALQDDAMNTGLHLMILNALFCNLMHYN